MPVIGDDFDEGEETLILTLSSPAGGNAWLADASATGTIENDDLIPRAWLARFGRTVAEQVLGAVESRFSGARSPGLAMSVAGQTLGGGSAETLDALEEREAARHLEALRRWLRGESEVLDGGGAGVGESRALTRRDVVTGTSFTLTQGPPSAASGPCGHGGRCPSFDGREEGLRAAARSERDAGRGL